MKRSSESSGEHNEIGSARRYNSGGSGNVGERRCNSDVSGKCRCSNDDNSSGRRSSSNGHDNGYPEKDEMIDTHYYLRLIVLITLRLSHSHSP